MRSRRTIRIREAPGKPVRILLCFAAMVMTGCVAESGANPLPVEIVSNTGSSGGFAGFVRSLNQTDYGTLRVQAPIRRGKYGYRFEVRPGDCGSHPVWSDCETDRERAELRSKDEFSPNQVRWFAWSMQIPLDFHDCTPSRVTFAQIHQIGGRTGQTDGFVLAPPLLQFLISSGRIWLAWHRLEGSPDALSESVRWFELEAVENLRGRWSDIVLYLNPHQESGALAVWVDGDLKVSYKGILLLFDAQALYFRFGLYRSYLGRYERLHGHPVPAQTLYFDEVRTGVTRAEVDFRYNPLLAPTD